MTDLLFLILEFFKTGLFAVGGGLATVPFLYEIAKNYDWFTTSDLINMIAISESTPGPVGVNMATFCGFVTCGVLGGLVATLALVLPSYVIICIVAGFLKKFQENRYVKWAFEGLRPTVVGLLATASLAIFKVTFFTETEGSLKELLAYIDYKAIVLFLIIFAGVWKFKKHPIVYIGIGAIVGIVMGYLPF